MSKEKIIVGVLVMMLLYGLISQAQSNKLDIGPPGSLKVVDIQILRPISTVDAVVLTPISIGMIPVANVCGVEKYSERILIESPWRFNTARKFGEFDEYKIHRPIRVISD
jgi:hypothetical protein